MCKRATVCAVVCIVQCVGVQCVVPWCKVCSVQCSGVQCAVCSAVYVQWCALCSVVLGRDWPALCHHFIAEAGQAIPQPARYTLLCTTLVTHVSTLYYPIPQAALSLPKPCYTLLYTTLVAHFCFVHFHSDHFPLIFFHSAHFPFTFSLGPVPV